MKLSLCAAALALATTVTAETEVNIQGQSGGFQVSDTDGAFETVQVRLKGVQELDDQGEAVGTSGSVKHSVNSFASQTFTTDIVTNSSYGGLNATRISYDITLDNNIGNILVDTYLFTEAGNITLVNSDDEVVEVFEDVEVGTVKFNVAVTDWNWCGNQGYSCSQGQTDQVGDALKLTFTVKQGTGEDDDEEAGTQDEDTSEDGPKQVQVGNAVLTLSDYISYDNGATFEELPSPATTSSTGIKTTVEVVFPRKMDGDTDLDMLYDPMLKSGASINGAATAATSAAVAIAALGGLYSVFS
eukprot:INCI19907.1.p1 GENE.INCI19907.1~~INCI19907.1.p1  ORF type:complete len:300 (+),score=72.24 INCI19907.1:364-1263(+)